MSEDEKKVANGRLQQRIVR